MVVSRLVKQTPALGAEDARPVFQVIPVGGPPFASKEDAISKRGLFLKLEKNVIFTVHIFLFKNHDIRVLWLELVLAIF